VEAVFMLRSAWVIAAVLGAIVVGFGGCGASAGSGVGGFTGDVTGSAVSGTSVGGASIVASSASSGGAGGGGGQIGAPCAADADCGALSCIADTASDPIFGGGPAGGFCTKVCAGDADCVSGGGVCYQIDPGQPGRCTLPCDIGPAIVGVDALFTPLDPAKCLGREDVRCAKSNNATGVCLPTCGDDSQCQLGRVCDPRRGVCVDMPSTGDPIGAVCDPTAAQSTCAGVCIGFDGGAATCTRPCVLGGEEINTHDCGGPEQGLCGYYPPTNGAGDTGFCAPACLAASDCQNPSFWCFPISTLTMQVNKGYCFTAQPCPNGQADCTAYTCTPTSYGSFCLDPMFAPSTADAGP
jgi:hypothetical protein